MWVIRIWGAPQLPRVLHGPGQCVVGDLLPALLGGEQVGVAGVFLDLGHGVGRSRAFWNTASTTRVGMGDAKATISR